MSELAQYQSPETVSTKWNGCIVNVINSTCGFPVDVKKSAVEKVYHDVQAEGKGALAGYKAERQQMTLDYMLTMWKTHISRV